MCYHYPKWIELPEIELYLDQVLLYVNQATSYHGTDDKGLTASMINNYVKHGHLKKPIKKKYNRHQIARLIVITALKNVFSIQEISETLELLTKNGQAQDYYDSFVACMNESAIDQLPEVVVSACQTLKRYDHTHQLVQALKGEVKNDTHT